MLWELEAVNFNFTPQLGTFLYAKLVDIKLCYYSLIHALSICQLSTIINFLSAEDKKIF